MVFLRVGSAASCRCSQSGPGDVKKSVICLLNLSNPRYIHIVCIRFPAERGALDYTAF